MILTGSREQSWNGPFVGAYLELDRIEPVGLFGIAPSPGGNGPAPSRTVPHGLMAADATCVRPSGAGLSSECIAPPPAGSLGLLARSVVASCALVSPFLNMVNQKP